jgi:hypothetical protein
MQSVSPVPITREICRLNPVSVTPTVHAGGVGDGVDSGVGDGVGAAR